MKSMTHAMVGGLAMCCILSFWTTTIISELFLSYQEVALVKHYIFYGMLVLIPAMAMTGGSGFWLAGKRGGRLIQAKKKRMKFIGLNGLLIMIPSAFILFQKSAANEFDIIFYIVQAIELSVGFVQLVLMGLNFRDGLQLSGKI
jgi:hypothetical protein